MMNKIKNINRGEESGFIQLIIIIIIALLVLNYFNLSISGILAYFGTSISEVITWLKTAVQNVFK